MIIQDPENDKVNEKYGKYIHMKALLLIALYCVPYLILEAQDWMEYFLIDQIHKKNE